MLTTTLGLYSKSSKKVVGGLENGGAYIRRKAYNRNRKKRFETSYTSTEQNTFCIYQS